MRPRVYVTQPIADSALLRLKEIAEVEVNHDSSRILAKPKLVDAAKRADIILCLLHDTIDRDVLAANPESQGDRLDDHHARPHRRGRGDHRARSSSPTSRRW